VSITERSTDFFLCTITINGRLDDSPLDVRIIADFLSVSCLVTIWSWLTSILKRYLEMRRLFALELFFGVLFFLCYCLHW